MGYLGQSPDLCQASTRGSLGVKGAERGSRLNQRWEGGPAEGRKKKVTSPILMVEVVVDVPKGTFPGVQNVFESL